jgi:hypothetical protein
VTSAMASAAKRVTASERTSAVDHANAGSVPATPIDCYSACSNTASSTPSLDSASDLGVATFLGAWSTAGKGTKTAATWAELGSGSRGGYRN